VRAARISFAAAGSRVIGPSVTPELQAWEELVNAVEKSGAVALVGGQYLVDHDLLLKAVPDPLARQTVLQSVVAANRLPQIRERPAAVAAAAEQPSLTDILEKFFNFGADTPAIERDVKAIAAGTTVVGRHWWGIDFAFTKPAGDALSSLLGKDLGNLAALLSTLGTLPGLAVLGTIAGVATVLLKGLSQWVDAAERGNGVRLSVIAWIFPFISSVAPQLPPTGQG
jgi:hypothetical protein